MFLPARAALLTACFAISVPAAMIQASLSGFTTGEEHVLNYAFGFWDHVIADPITLSLSVEKTTLAGDLLSITEGFAADSNGLPASARIRVDDRVNDPFGWFIDPTPGVNEEFTPGATPWQWRGDLSGPAGENYDLLTLVNHEIAHAFGFSVQYSRFAAQVGPGVGSLRSYNGAGFTATLTAPIDGTHLSDSFHPFDLMNAFQSRGQRLLPSDLDFAILSDAFGYTISDGPPSAVPEPATVVMIGAALALLAIRRKNMPPAL